MLENIQVEMVDGKQIVKITSADGKKLWTIQDGSIQETNISTIDSLIRWTY